MIKTFLILLSFITLSNNFAQTPMQFGSRLKFSNQNNYYKGSTDNFPYSYIHKDVKSQSPGIEIVGRSTSYSPQNDTSKFSVKYSLEVGLLFFKLQESRIYIPSNPEWISDTIGTYYTSKSKGTKLGISNFIDLTYKISDKLTLINSLGFKIETRDGIKKKEFEYGYLLNDYEHQDRYNSKREIFSYNVLYDSPKTFPLTFKLLFSPQLIVKYNKFSLNINLIQDILILNRLSNNLNTGKLNLSTFTGVGLFIIPHFNTKADEEELLKDDFDY